MGNFLRIQDSKEEPPRRIIWPHTNAYPQCALHPMEDHMKEMDPNHQFADNRVRTTKYSFFTFLPINLYEQFHRFANIYFLFICILNFLPEVAAFGKEVAPVPVIVVLSITAVKDAYEDFRRYRADREVNQSLCEVYYADSGTFRKTEWKRLRPGDIVRLLANNIIPADMLLLHSSDKSGLCHIETASLDGESNLKQREVIRGFQVQNFDPRTFKYRVDVEGPNPEIYRFSGRLLMEEDTAIPLKKENMILRGCIVRNTESVVGMVIYAGHETKAMLNNRQAAFKRSKLERQLNKDVIWCVIVLVILCLTGAVCSGLWLGSFPPNAGLFLSDARKDSTLQAFLNFWTFVIIFQAMIPLPLYVTLEFVKLGQVFYIQKDLDLYDEVYDKPVEVKAFNIPEDLGQIQYMFTDKTGTLTENKMEFRRCSIYGNDFAQVGTASSLCDSLLTSSTVPATPSDDLYNNFPPPYYHRPMSSIEPQPLSILKSTFDSMSLRPFCTGNHEMDVLSNAVRDFFFLLALCNTVVVSTNKNATEPVTKSKKRMWRSGPGGESSNSLFAITIRRPQLAQFRNLFPRSKKGSQPDQIPTPEGPEVDEYDEGAGDEVTNGSTDRSSSRQRSTMKSKFFTHEEIEEDLELSTAYSQAPATVLSRPQIVTRIRNLLTWNGPNSTTAMASGEIVCQSPSEVVEGVDTPQLNINEAPEDQIHLQVNSRPHSTNNLDSPSVIHKVPPVNTSTPNFHHSPHPNPNPVRETIVTPTAQKRPEQLSESCTVDVSTLSTFINVTDLSYTSPNNNASFAASLSGVNNLETLLQSYEAESPDEMALVKVAAVCGCKLLQRAPGFVSVSMPGQNPFEVDVMHILPFDSDRKRMSVIFRHPLNLEITLFCKGADTSMLQILAKVTQEKDPDYYRIINKTKQQINLYARLGLRTLVMGKRVIPVDEYNKWKLAYDEAFGMGDESALKRLTLQVERDLMLLGATGIEDKLQEGVPETIEALRMAGINIWVLTGDKQETAVNISYTAKLISEEQRLMILKGSVKQEVKNRIRAYQEEIDRIYPPEVEIRQRHHRPPVRPDLALCVDGCTLEVALDPDVKFDFLHLAEQCASVICCRSTPKQKAEVVKLVKENLHMQTLAIGDGANDVNMIRAADVGIGISGQEGMQAVMASDFAISRFKFLRPLLLVHGHCNYDKLSRIGLYIFYKCTVFIMVMFWFQIFNGFSGQTMIGQLYQVFFNLTFTSLPPIIMGIWDKTMNQSTLLKNPVLYTEGQNCRSYLPWHFWLNIADALWQSVIWFFVPYLVFVDSDISLWSFGDVCMTIAVVSALVHLGLETKSWTIMHLIAQLGSLLVAWFAFALLYNAFCVSCMPPESPYWVIYMSLQDARFWLCTLLASTISLLPRVVVHTVKNTLWPSLTERARQLEREFGEGKVLPLMIPSQVYPIIPGTHNSVQLGLSASRRTSHTSRSHSVPQRSHSEKVVNCREAQARKAYFASLSRGCPDSSYMTNDESSHPQQQQQQQPRAFRVYREQYLSNHYDPRGHKRSRSSAAAITNWGFERHDSTSALFGSTWGPKKDDPIVPPSWNQAGTDSGEGSSVYKQPVPPSTPSVIPDLRLFQKSSYSSSRNDSYHV